MPVPFKDNASHLNLSGKSIDVIPSQNGALLQISDPNVKSSRNSYLYMNKQEYNKFLSLDESHRKKFVENFIQKNDSQTYKEMTAHPVAMYWYGPEKKFHVPVSHAELNKLISLDEPAKGRYFRELLREKDPQQYNAMRNTEKSISADRSIRGVAQTPWQRDGSATRQSENQGKGGWANIFKKYPDEQLNPRISKVRPFAAKDEIFLKMEVDGKEKGISVTNKNTVDAFNKGALSTNTLANKVLEVLDKQPESLSAHFDILLDEQRSQGQNYTTGLKR